MNISRIGSLHRHRYNVNTTSKIASIKKNNHIQKRSNSIRAKSFNDDIVSVSYYIGKGIIVFTLFYTSLNYFHYKRLREEYEEENKDDETKK
jgi:hypothetical protein